jgi:hypothetical protein
VAESKKDQKDHDFSLQSSIENRNVSFSVRSNLDFFADSGATSHMSDQQQFFDTLEMIDTGTRQYLELVVFLFVFVDEAT